MARRGLSLAPKVPQRPAIDSRNAPDWFHAGQQSVWDSPAIDPVACAGAQGGKTILQAPWLLREIQRCAPLIRQMRGGKFLYAGPTLELLKQQALPAFRQVFQEEGGYGRLTEGNKPRFTFSASGLRKLFGFDDYEVVVSFAYTNDSSNLESMTAFGGVWDEAGQKENRIDSYGAFNRRLKVARSTTFESVLEYAPDWWIERFYDAEGPDATFGRRLWGTTPYEWNWFKTDIWEKADKGQDGFELLNWPSWMNPRVSEEECRKELARIPIWQWQMMYEGKFTKPAGVIYDTFDYDRDTCAEFDILEKGWKIYPGIDFGSVNMGGVLIAEDPETKTLYVIRDYLAGSRTFREHADHIRGVPGVTPCYPLQVGAGGSHQEDGWREAFRSNNLPLDEPPTNEVEVGIGCVYGQFKTHSLKIFRTCKRLIGEVQHYSRELDASGTATEKIADKAKFHCCDALRYIVAKLRLKPSGLAYMPHFGKVTMQRPSPTHLPRR